jgi:hypothetical protein
MRLMVMTLLLTCPLTWPGAVGQIVRPVNAEGIDIKILSSDVNWEGVLNMDSEAKNHSIPLNLGTLRKCIVRIPANTNVHFIFCKAIDRAAFSIAKPTELKVDGVSTDRDVKLLVVAAAETRHSLRVQVDVSQ